MPSTRLTAQFVNSRHPPASGRIEYWDTHTRGLGLRVTDKGAKSWVVMYRTGGRQRRLTLGSFPKIKLAAAREMALEALNAVARGRDPAEEKKEARNTIYVAPETVAKAAEAYIEQRVRPRNRSWKETRRIFDKYVIPALGRRPLEEITRRDVSALVDDIAANGTPYMANRVRAGLSAFFNWCIEKSKIEVSPAMGVKAPCEESSRDRVLSDAEIRKLWRAWDKMGFPFGDAFRCFW